MISRYVYELSDPRIRAVIYVGIGVRKRAWSHWKTFTSTGKHPNPILHAVFVGMLADKIEPEVKIVFNGTSEEAKNLEKELIRKYGRKINKEGSLCNVTAGGDGLDPETLRNLWKDPLYRERICEAVRQGHKVSEKSKAYFAWMKSAEGKRVISVRNKAVSNREDVRAKLSENAVKQFSSDEARRKQSDIKKKAWKETPERFANVHSDQARAKRSAAVKAFWANPENRERMRAAMKVANLQKLIKGELL